MSKQLVNIGAQPDDNTGDPLRSAFDKINENFNELYGSLGDGTDLGLAIDDDGNIDISNNLTVTGDLVVNGQTTTISSQTVTFEDNILLINKADDDDTPYNTTSAGIEIEKTGTNPSFIHTFSDSTWTLSDNLDVDGDIVADNLTVADSIIHEGDADTKISFTNDQININAGIGKSAIFLSNTIRLQESDSSNVAVDLVGSASYGYLRLFGNGADKVTIQGNGNSYFNGGNLGIGTFNPSEKLDVNGNLKVDDSVAIAATPEANTRLLIHGYGSGAGTTSLHIKNTGGSTSLFKFKDNGQLDWGNGADEGTLTWDSNEAVVRGQTGKGLRLASNGQNADYIYIDTSGNVGMGKNNPSSTLDVNGTIAFNSLKDSGENITITKFVDEADTIASNNNDTTIPTSAAVIDYVDTEVAKAKAQTATTDTTLTNYVDTTSTTDRNNSYKIMGLAMDYLSRVHNDGGTVEGMEDVMKNTEELILA